MTSHLDRDVRAWIDASRYDLRTAGALLQSRRYLYVLFMCQQAVEKLLKALVTERTRTFPPRIHALVRLAELAAVDLSDEQRMLLERLSLYYIQSRYPPEIRDLAKRVSRVMARTHFEQTEHLWKRLRREVARKK